MTGKIVILDCWRILVAMVGVGLALSRVTSGQSTSRSVRRPPAYSGAAPPPPPPPPNPFRATPSSRGESSYARRERLSRQMDL